MRLCDLISVSLEQRLDHGLEVCIQLFGRRLHFVFAYPPLDHFDKAAGDVIQEEIFGDGDFLVVVQEVGVDEARKACLEVAQEEVGAFRDEQIAQVVCILCDMLQKVAEDRIRKAGMLVIVRGVVVIHDTVHDVLEELLTHVLQEAVLGLEMGIECAAADIGTVDDILDGDF